MLHVLRKYILVISFVFCAAFTYAQKEQETWFFGQGLGMSFKYSNVTPITPPAYASSQYSYATSCMSDKNTGKLLFYVAGLGVYDRDHHLMPNSMAINPSVQYLIIVPDPGDSLQYYILYSYSHNIYYSKVDMRLNDGLGDVTMKEIPVFSTANIDSRFAVVKLLYNAGYWLIVHRAGTTIFQISRITKYSIGEESIMSPTSEDVFWPQEPDAFYSEMVTSSDGSMLAVLDNSSSKPNNKFVLLYDFDKRCGKVTFKKKITHQGFLYDVAFDAEGNFLYVTGTTQSGGDASIIQYDLMANNNPDDVFPTVPVAVGIRPLRMMKLGPDNKIYITNMEMIGNGYSASRYVDVIHKPSVKGSGCNYQYLLNLSPNNLCYEGRWDSPCYLTDRFPTLIQDRTIQQPPNFEEPELEINNFCLGQTTIFTLKDTTIIADSVAWVFGKNTANSFSKTTSYTYANPGTYYIRFYWYLCGLEYLLTKKITIGETPTAALGPDTTLCNGDLLMITAGDTAGKYEWSTGETSYAIVVNKPGSYWVTTSNGDCQIVAKDEINVSYYPSLWLSLGDEYFICDKEKELVKLDAGEGFATYKWTPTGDTSQWIIVGDLGDYFVVVKDFRGCSGSDGTKVKRICPINLYFPNVFTPNNDGVNDLYAPTGTDVIYFNMSIYNRWGEKVFETNDLNKRWDGSVKGKPVQPDVYFYLATYSGYFNKKLQTYTAKGDINLIR